MGAGGARLRSGPAPDPNALRRDRDAKDWVKLPHEGRTAEVPEWPAELPNPTVAELSMWGRLWRLPQALVWEADRGSDIVALYIRVYCDAVSSPEAPAARATQAKQLAEALLLTTPALHSARYVIASPAAPRDEAEGAMDRHPSNQTRRTGGARSLLKVVESTEDADPDTD